MNMYKNILKTFSALFFGVTMVGISSFAHADLLADAAKDETIRQEPGSIEVIESLKMAGSACEDWASEKGWTLGNNQKKDGTPFFVSMGSGTISAPLGHQNYINERQNAYEKAVLNAKAELVKYMNNSIQQELTLATSQGTFSAEPILTSENTPAKPEEPAEHGWETAYSKTLRLLHAELDKQLGERGVDPNPEPTEAEKRAAEEAAREIFATEEFRQLITATAKSQLKGVRRMFVKEEVSPNEKQGSICVVMLGSPKTMAMADAIMTGNPNIAPTGYFGKPISEQVPDEKTPEGLKELMTSYGVQMVRDEVGEFHLITYAQAGSPSTNKMLMANAKKIAISRAQGALASFAKEYTAVTSRTENASSAKAYADSMEEIDYQGGAALEEVIKSTTPMVDIQGARVRSSWAAKHPVTKQVVVGVVYQWSPGSAVAAKQLLNNINQTARPAGGAPAKAINTGQGFQGSASRGSSQSDF